jgi:hypothetical protein
MQSCGSVSADGCRQLGPVNTHGIPEIDACVLYDVESDARECLEECGDNWSREHGLEGGRCAENDDAVRSFHLTGHLFFRQLNAA